MGRNTSFHLSCCSMLQSCSLFSLSSFPIIFFFSSLVPPLPHITSFALTPHSFSLAFSPWPLSSSSSVTFIEETVVVVDSFPIVLWDIADLGVLFRKRLPAQLSVWCQEGYFMGDGGAPPADHSEMQRMRERGRETDPLWCSVTGDSYLVSSQGSCDGTHSRYQRLSDPDPGDLTILDPDPDGGFPPEIWAVAM